MPDLDLDTKATALVVIDLQNGIAAQPAKPYPANVVVRNAAQLVQAFRKNGMPVFLVHVIVTSETALKVNSDFTIIRPSPLPANWSDFVPEMTPAPTDIVIAKKQWGAFYGTDLELQLRRRKLDTIVLCGIATDMGVESTARFAYEYGFQQIFAEDAMSSMNEDAHNAAVRFVFPRMGRVRKTGEILKAI